MCFLSLLLETNVPFRSAVHLCLHFNHFLLFSMINHRFIISPLHRKFFSSSLRNLISSKTYQHVVSLPSNKNNSTPPR
ncbi:hypothetical protein VIGAN_UM002400 [Vigna angularis var. angularis]|uniref:Uncharacterized protein n=1 Tax=Vigna angularis var. angularis TaxID=157739 RepID=A0A0S3TD08_PHAAN|nr:hypothetical protein VIGAN_UM002400 [Vigna angularis var. angularis]